MSEAGGAATITVTRTGDATGGVTVDYATTDGTANAPADYTASSGTLTFAAGETNKPLMVPVVDDGIAEPSETVNLTLSNPTGAATLGSRKTATPVIIDTSVTLEFSASTYTVSEAAGTATITVIRSGPTTGSVGVSYATSAGTATADVDYKDRNGVLSFGPGVTTQTLTIPILNDTLQEPDETVNLTLSTPTGGASLGSRATATLVIAGQIPPVNPVITTSDTGTMLVLQTQTPTETVRVGLLKSWGGAITEVSLNGTDYVNNDDPGREIQTSLWDGNGSYGASWGWDPVEAGDHFYHGSPLLASTLTPDSIYTKTWPIQWAPENFGGGWDDPVPGDAYIEKWISVVPGYNRVFKVHYKITHFGTDAHAEATQELPMMSVNPNVPNFVYYAGDAPWTNGALSRHTMSSVCCDNLHTPEGWGAYLDGTDIGIALYTPGQYPNGKGFNAGPALGFTPTCPYTWDPGAVLEFDTFILVGAVTESRAAIYSLHSQQSGQSPLPPLGYAGVTGGEVLSGTATVEGWAWALAGLASVDVFVDGERVGSATYGLARPDVSAVFPGAPADVGFQYSLDTTAYPNGSHTVVAKATDNAGHVATFATKQVTFSN